MKQQNEQTNTNVRCTFFTISGLFRDLNTVHSQWTVRSCKIFRAVSIFTLLMGTPDFSCIRTSWTTSVCADIFKECLNIHWNPTSDGWRRPVHPAGTKRIMMVSWLTTIHVRNSSDQCTDQQSVSQSEHCACRSPNLTLKLSKYWARMVLTKFCMVAWVDQYVAVMEDSIRNPASLASRMLRQPFNGKDCGVEPLWMIWKGKRTPLLVNVLRMVMACFSSEPRVVTCLEFSVHRSCCTLVGVQPAPGHCLPLVLRKYLHA